jgi:hypothetical protein
VIAEERLVSEWTMDDHVVMPLVVVVFVVTATWTYRRMRRRATA